MADPSVPDASVAAGTVSSTKDELRRSMRAMRRSITDRTERSERIWHHVRVLVPDMPGVRLMAFESVTGEPETLPFLAWCSASGLEIAVPVDEPVPTWPDVVIVPGVAFTRRGDRLGQGGGWYDRFLAGVRPECRTIGVGFVEQIVDALPVEDHDICLHHVVTEWGDVTTRPR